MISPGDPGRFTEDAEGYKAVAAEVMTDHGIRVNDLYHVSSSLYPQVFVVPGNVHFSAEGYACLGLATAREIKIALDLFPPRLSEKQPSNLRN